jgi:hypothetical protein
MLEKERRVREFLAKHGLGYELETLKCKIFAGNFSHDDVPQWPEKADGMTVYLCTCASTRPF